jgi:hypothetical protein
MPGDEEVELATVYAEVDKRIKAACDALKAEFMAELDKRFPPKKKFSIVNRPPATGS